VVVETAPVSVLSASLLLLLVPLIGLIVGATLGSALGPDLGLGEESGPILGGLLLMAVAYLGVSGVDRRIRRRSGGTGARIVEVTRADGRPGDPLDGSSPIG
jgi:positive regulator of sigma E activity